MSSWLQAIGTAVPELSISQDAALAIASEHGVDERQRRILKAIYRSSGIASRRAIALKQLLKSGGPNDVNVGTAARMQCFAEEAAPLAIAAASSAIKRSNIEVCRITEIVTVSCTGFTAPGIDLALIKNLGLSPGVSRTNVGFMGCHGAINGLRVADALVSRAENRTALMVAVELCSLHFQFDSSPDSMMATALFGDGAAAAVLSSSKSSSVKLSALGSGIVPDSQALMAWHVGDHGFEMTLSSQLPDLLRTSLRPWIENWLRENSLKIADIGSWAIHPGGPRIIDAAADALGLNSDQTAASRHVLSSYGNMSSPTVLFIVEELRANPDWMPCVVLAFGPGINIEAALLTKDIAAN
jgi:predicted naringenin-chalcone synthase